MAGTGLGQLFELKPRSFGGALLRDGLRQSRLGTRIDLIRSVGGAAVAVPPILGAPNLKGDGKGFRALPPRSFKGPFSEGLENLKTGRGITYKSTKGLFPPFGFRLSAFDYSPSTL